MNDTLTLKLDGQAVEVRKDDDGRYCLNDIHKAAGKPATKRPVNFMTHKGSSYRFNKEKVKVLGKGRGASTWASEDVFYEYIMYLSKDWYRRIAMVLGRDEDEVYLPPYEDVSEKSYKESSLYLMQNEWGLYKIGITSNIDQRVKSIAHASGVPTKVIKEWKSEELPYEAYCVEDLLHIWFGHYNTVGEWFNMQDSPEDLSGAIDHLLTDQMFVMQAGHFDECLKMDEAS